MDKVLTLLLVGGGLLVYWLGGENASLAFILGVVGCMVVVGMYGGTRNEA